MCSNPSPCQTKWLWNSQSPETTAAATAAHRTYPSSPAAATLQEKHKVSCPGFLPTQVPCNIHAAIISVLHRFAAARAHSCSHYNAICIHALQNTKEEPIRPRNDRSRNRRTQDLPFIAGCSHLTRKTQGFVPWIPPQPKSHATFMQPLQCVLLCYVMYCCVMYCCVMSCYVMY